MNVIHFDPTRPEGTFAPHERKHSGAWMAPKEGPRITCQEAGEYVYSSDIKCWVRRKPFVPPVVPPKACAMPKGDGSGVFWEICEWFHKTRRWGQPMWTIEARSLEEAIREKTRLCLSRGLRPGWGRVRPC